MPQPQFPLSQTYLYRLAKTFVSFLSSPAITNSFRAKETRFGICITHLFTRLLVTHGAIPTTAADASAGLFLLINKENNCRRPQKNQRNQYIIPHSHIRTTSLLSGIPHRQPPMQPHTAARLPKQPLHRCPSPASPPLPLPRTVYKAT